MVVDGASMAHFGLKATSASDGVGMVAILPPLLRSARRGAPFSPHDATPRLEPRQGEAAPRHRADCLLGVSWDRSAKVEGDLDGAALLLGRQRDEGVAPFL